VRFAIEDAFSSSRLSVCEVAGGTGDGSLLEKLCRRSISAVKVNYRLDKLAKSRFNVRPPEPEASSSTKAGRNKGQRGDLDMEGQEVQT
jgi:hypothetical protein